MENAGKKFIHEYCKRYGVKTVPGPGVPMLNGKPLVGEELEKLFLGTDKGQ